MATITLNGRPLHTNGDLPAIGSKAADFTMSRDDLTEIRLNDCLGKSIIMNIFPSLDTPTCAAAMKRFNELAGNHANIEVLCVSADLPFAQKRFCTTERLKNVTPVSTFRNPEFGDNYGIKIVDGPMAGLLARAVVVLDEHGTVIYNQLVHEIADEPDYQAIINCLKLA